MEMAVSGNCMATHLPSCCQGFFGLSLKVDGSLSHLPQHHARCSQRVYGTSHLLTLLTPGCCVKIPGACQWCACCSGGTGGENDNEDAVGHVVEADDFHRLQGAGGEIIMTAFVAGFSGLPTRYTRS